MVRTGASVEWTVVTTEVEALQLEYAWIKEFDPRFNVRYRDDKSYPYLAVTLGEEFPRAQVMRGAKRKGTRYFGPYAHAWAIRETLDLALRVFPVRTCSAGVFKRAGQVGRPCLLGYIDKCSAPCVGRVDAQRHREIAEDFCDFMAGETGRFLGRLTTRCGRPRPSSTSSGPPACATTSARSSGSSRSPPSCCPTPPTPTSSPSPRTSWRSRCSSSTCAAGGCAASAAGSPSGTPRPPPRSSSTSSSRSTAARRARRVPREVLVPVLPDDAEALAEWLSGLRGSRVDLRVPRRGDKRTLMETVARNATQSLARHKVARAGDLTTRSQALQQIQDALELEEAPLRIECFDISHVQGTQVVGSMVVFEDGLPRKSEYRRFIVRGDETGATDDTAAMHEVLTRRFRRGRLEEAGASGMARRRPRRCRDPAPDGAGARGGGPAGPLRLPPQPRRRRRRPAPGQRRGPGPRGRRCRRRHRRRPGQAPRGGVAPGEEFPVVLPRTSEGLYLLQRLRDEAHRFAITFHRQRRSKAMTASRLDGIPGLGEKRRKALLSRFGSVKKIGQASVEELAAVPGIGPALAAVVAAELGSDRGHHPRGQPRDRRGRRRRRSGPCRRSPRRADERRRGRVGRRCPGRPTSSSSRG